jgi:hypothetical protein
MKATATLKAAKNAASGVEQIDAYSLAQRPAMRTMCEQLRELIEAALHQATAKVWHGSPVWFSGENPVVGYNVTAKGVSLLFWNGQALAEPALQPVGKYGAAQAVFADAAEIDAAAVRRWLKKAKANVFDSQAFFQGLREARKAESKTRAGAHKRRG